jgi:hypothetical protein
MGASPKRVSKTGGRNIVARPADGPAGSAWRYWLGAVTVQDSQQQARRVIGAEIVAAGDQTRCKPRQSRTMARCRAFRPASQGRHSPTQKTATFDFDTRPTQAKPGDTEQHAFFFI